MKLTKFFENFPTNRHKSSQSIKIHLNLSLEISIIQFRKGPSVIIIAINYYVMAQIKMKLISGILLAADKSSNGNYPPPQSRWCI